LASIFNAIISIEKMLDGGAAGENEVWMLVSPVRMRR
jgi:hypothetical protein